MWLQLSSPPTAICLDDLGAIEGDALEWVHGNQHNTGVGIDAMLGISVSNGVEDCREKVRLQNRHISAGTIPEGSLR